MRLILLLLLLSANIHAAQWQQVKNKQNIEVYQQKLTDGLIKIKAITSVNSCIDGFQNLILDTEQTPLWVTSVNNVTLLSQPSKSEHIVYTQLNAPWPIKNRDMVTYSRITRRANTQLQIGIQAVSELYPLQKDYVRIEQLAASWVATQKTGNELVVEYQVLIEPAGKIPLWLANSVAKNNVYKTFRNLRRHLKEDVCQRAKL